MDPKTHRREIARRRLERLDKLIHDAELRLQRVMALRGAFAGGGRIELEATIADLEAHLRELKASRDEVAATLASLSQDAQTRSG